MTNTRDDGRRAVGGGRQGETRRECKKRRKGGGYGVGLRE
jgi:hypothetical protein